jgi:hypothetical protein
VEAGDARTADDRPAVLRFDEEVKMEENRLIGSFFSPGRGAMHVLIRADRHVEVVANSGAVVEGEPLDANHVLTLDPEELTTFTSLLRYAGSFVNP